VLCCSEKNFRENEARKERRKFKTTYASFKQALFAHPGYIIQNKAHAHTNKLYKYELL
jgi:hypothetical protein